MSVCKLVSSGPLGFDQGKIPFYFAEIVHIGLVIASFIILSVTRFITSDRKPYYVYGSLMYRLVLPLVHGNPCACYSSKERTAVITSGVNITSGLANGIKRIPLIITNFL